MPNAPVRLKAVRARIDTYQQHVVYMREDCHVCRAEGFEAQAEVELVLGPRQAVAVLHRVSNGWLAADEVGLSEAMWRQLDAQEGEPVVVRHPLVPRSLGHLRTKVYGGRLDYAAVRAIIDDISAGRLSDLHLAAFVTACAGGRLDGAEIVALTRAMVDVGERLQWDTGPVMDKHCVGGLPGNRTSLLVVPIVAACGAMMPKTSSRAITSPAGTADTMETLAPVTLDLAAMRRVVEREGGCIVWGGAMALSPADDLLIRVERPLDLDSDGQLIASVLSKKAAVGAQRVVIDMPVGPTAKIRSAAAARALADGLVAVGATLGMDVRVLQTDGSQPVGRGIGPALEARDVLAVLRRDAGAPPDLRERALLLAGQVLELAGKAAAGQGLATAQAALDDGRALAKFVAICEGQGGLREPPVARFGDAVVAPRAGRVEAIDNRRLARAAKLAGAPRDAAAGVVMQVRLGERVERGQPLFTLYSQSRGGLGYALGYVGHEPDIVALGDEWGDE